MKSSLEEIRSMDSKSICYCRERVVDSTQHDTTKHGSWCAIKNKSLCTCTITMTLMMIIDETILCGRKKTLDHGSKQK